MMISSRPGPLRQALLALRLALIYLLAQSVALSANALAEGVPEKDGHHEILLYGDSIAAGYGLTPDDALAGQLASRLATDGLNVIVQNGGVSGDTTAGGLSRLAWTLNGRAELVIIILGGNDAMRGLTPSQSEDNLDQLITALRSLDLKVLLTGMRAPPNLGADYAAAFEPMYARLAAKHGLALYPFLLEGVAADPALNQADGIHPNAEGVAIMAQGLAPLVAGLLAPRTP